MPVVGSSSDTNTFHIDGGSLTPDHIGHAVQRKTIESLTIGPMMLRVS